MTPESVREAAGLLLEARRGRRTVPSFPDGMQPATAAEGYAIQDAFVEACGLDVAGWKIGCTAEDQQRFVGVSEPFSGRVFRQALAFSPVTISAGAFSMCGIEGEFAFHMAADLAPREQPREVAEVAAAVASLHPAVEIVDSRFDDWLATGGPRIIADNGCHGALVVGGEVRDWSGIDLAAAPVRVDVDRRTRGEGTGARVLGHPLNALTWLVNHLSGRGLGLAAGDYVTTGTCTGITFVEAGNDVRVDFGGLGAIRINFED